MSSINGQINGRGIGVAAALLTTLSWGGQFPVGTSAMAVMDPVWLTALRYGIAGLVLVAILAWREGPEALRPSVESLRVAVLGVVGFAGFNLLVYVGLRSTGAQSASLIVSTMPLVTAFVLWARTGRRPARVTWWASLVALAGVALVLTSGDLGRLVHGGFGSGHVLVLAGVVSWVFYTTGAMRHPSYSPLRFTAVSAVGGSAAILLIALALTGLGVLHAPTGTDVAAIWWQLIYVSLLAGVIAVLSWTVAVQRLGAQSAALFINVVPVTTFVIVAAAGHRPYPAQVAGVLVTIVALLGSSVVTRRAQARALSTGAQVAVASRSRPDVMSAPR